MPTFAERIPKRAASRIYLVRGNDSTGRAAWYYLLIERRYKRRFEFSACFGQLQLTDFGKIILSGYGEYPPPDVKKRMKVEYGFEE
jgi:hypothetical protein